MDVRIMNNHVLDILAKVVEGKKIQSLPKLICNDGTTPRNPGLDFTKSHELITHKDFTNELDKKCAVFLAQHSEGCLVCLYLLNHFGKKFIILPHLYNYSNQTSNYFLSKSSKFCP